MTNYLKCVRCAMDKPEESFLEKGPLGGLCLTCATRVAMLLKTEQVDRGEPSASTKILGLPQYTHKQWDFLLDNTVNQLKLLSSTKGSEYAGDNDRLANFRRNGRALGLPMETVWAVYAGKHWDAIQQYVKDLFSGNKRTRSEPISGRADDLIVYLLLFKAMCEERQEPTTGQQVFPSTLDKA